MITRKLGLTLCTGLLGLIIVCSCIQAQDNSNDSSNASDQMVAFEAEFSSRIFAEFAQQPTARNWVVSPYGLFQVLGVLSEAAKGKAQTELRRSLFGNVRDPDFDPSNDRLWKSLTRIGDAIEFRFAHSVSENGGYGVRITAIRSSDPEQTGGLHENDLILVANGRAIRSPEDFEEVCRRSNGELQIDGFEYELGSLFSKRRVRLQPTTVPAAMAQTTGLQNSNLFLYSEQLTPTVEFLDRTERLLALVATPVAKLDASMFQTKEFAQWLTANFQGRITKDHFAGLDVDGAQFLIANFCNFDSAWDCQVAAIEEFEFHSFDSKHPVEGISLKGAMQVGETDNGIYVKIPLRSSGFFLNLCLPKEEGLEGLAQSLNERASRRDRGPLRFTSRNVNLKLPVFNVSTALRREHIGNLCGLSIALTEDANYPEIGAEATIGAVSQASAIHVDGSGVHARATTVALGVPRELDNRTYQAIVIDRPFVFELEHQSGVVIFQGQFVSF